MIRIAVVALIIVPCRMVAQGSRIVVDTVHSASLANLLGAPAATRVSIYLPPGYDSSTTTRYPTVYLLHGFGSNDASFARAVQPAMDSALAHDLAKPMIVVMPSASNRFGGSFYVNSFTTGNWDDFISRDLVAWVDARYRTVAQPESRGIAGHSMGGFGAFHLGMRHGGSTYGAMYAMSACCTHVVPNPVRDGPAWDTVAAMLPPTPRTGLLPIIMTAVSAAFAPDSSRPPYFFRPEVVRDGATWVIDTTVAAKWDAHSILRMLPAYRANLLKLTGLMFDVGEQDELVPRAELSAIDSALTRALVPHRFETYAGTHSDHIAERLAIRVFPFFSQTLRFTQKKE